MRTRWTLGFVVGLTIAGSSCGGAKDSVTPKVAGGLTADQIDADPLALLPGSAVILAGVDAQAFYKSGSVGAQLSGLAEKLAPIGDEAGFSPSRDVDRVTLGVYALEGADVAAVVSGRFDQAKIDQAASNHTPTKSGGPVTASQYAGRTLYTVSNIGFTVITAHTAIAGTETGIRRTLDRIQDGHLKRDIAPWMITTIETKDAETTLAADLSGLAVTAVQGIPLPWLQGLKMVRVLGDFRDPGLNVAGTLTYADAASAQAGASGVKQIGTLVNAASVFGWMPQLKNLSVNAVDTNVECKFAVDDQGLRSLLSQASQWVPAGN
jgi:hypothetical protein